MTNQPPSLSIPGTFLRFRFMVFFSINVTSTESQRGSPNAAVVSFRQQMMILQ